LKYYHLLHVVVVPRSVLPGEMYISIPIHLSGCCSADAEFPRMT